MRRACSREGRAVRDDGEEERERETAKLYAKIWPTDGRTGFLGQEARAMSAPDRRADGRTAWQGPGSRAPPMRACGRGALGGLLPQARRRGGRSGGDAPHRRTGCISNFRSYGSRRMTFELNKEGPGVNCKRVRRWMRVMGIEALGSAPRHEQSAAPRAQDIPILAAAALKIVEPNHVWAADVTYIPMACGFLYHSGGDHRLGQPGGSGMVGQSNTNDASFCAAALEEAKLLRFGKPRIFNTDQGSTFTAEAFTASKLVTAGVVISIRTDAAASMDNIFIERLWRSIKYEEVHLKAYADGCEARSGISSRINFYTFRRSSPGDEQPDADGGMARRHGQNRGGGEGCGYAASPPDNANALPTYPQQKQQEAA